MVLALHTYTHLKIRRLILITKSFILVGDDTHYSFNCNFEEPPIGQPSLTHGHVSCFNV